MLWISVDGFRGDYVDRGVSPFLASLLEHGAYTRQMTPIFPSLTFPSHCAEATGVHAGIHGIVSNKWFDTTRGEEFNMPGDPNLLEAEPIWLTAARQGLRVAVLDWPLAQGEDKLPKDIPRAVRFNEKWDNDLKDPERLERIVEAYQKDADDPQKPEPMRLLMAYIHDNDDKGHKFGPESPEATKSIAESDQLLKKVVGEVAEIFKKRMHPERGDALYVLITTDHGMDDVKKLVNLKQLMGGAAVHPGVRGVTSGSLANIYLNDVPGAEREAVKRKILDKIMEARFSHVWSREQLPPAWQYGNPTRTGDIVVSLVPGYDFTSRHEDALITPAETDPKALKGMHGYDPAEDSKMLGFSVLYRWGSDQPGKDLGPVDSLRFDPTVAKLLGIKPAAGAKAAPLEVVP